jgi:hypothetical protein
MPATLQPVIVTPSLPLLLAFYKALLGAVEISRMPEDGPAFYVGLQIGNAELGMVADGDADVAAPQRILLNVNVADLGSGTWRACWNTSRSSAAGSSARRTTCPGGSV